MFNINFINKKGLQDNTKTQKQTNRNIENKNFTNKKEYSKGPDSSFENNKKRFPLKFIVSFLLILILSITVLDLISENSKIKKWYYGENNKIYSKDINLLQILKIVNDYGEESVLEDLVYDNINKELFFKISVNDNSTIYYNLMNSYTALFPLQVKGYNSSQTYIIEFLLYWEISSYVNGSKTKAELKNDIINISADSIDIDELIDARVVNNKLIYKIKKIENIITIIDYLTKNDLFNGLNISIEFNREYYKYDFIIE